MANGMKFVLWQDGILRPIGNRLPQVGSTNRADYQSAAGFHPATQF
jgi:hypothetical protein